MRKLKRYFPTLIMTVAAAETLIHYVADMVKALAMFSMKNYSGFCEQIMSCNKSHILKVETCFPPVYDYIKKVKMPGGQNLNQKPTLI